MSTSFSENGIISKLWCTSLGKQFEDVTDCWDLLWQNWRGE